jgi:hypothetical protein
MGGPGSRRLLAAIVCAVACALVIAGCGSSGSDSGSSDAADSPLSKAAYVKSADAICAKAAKEVEAQFAAYLKKNGIKEIGESGESSAETEEHVLDAMETVAIPAFNRQIEELSALEAPSELKAKAGEFIAAAETAIEKGEGKPLLIYTSQDKLFARSDKVANELGFQVCGQH